MSQDKPPLTEGNLYLPPTASVGSPEVARTGPRLAYTLMRVGAVATGFVVLACQRGAFPLWGFVCLALLVWVPYVLIVEMFSRNQVKPGAAKIGIWVLATVLVWAVYTQRAEQTRSMANGVANKVLAYQARYGRCPQLQTDLGLDRKEYEKVWGIHYACFGGGPYLSHRSVYMVFDDYVYDFNTKEWVFHPD